MLNKVKMSLVIKVFPFSAMVCFLLALDVFSFTAFFAVCIKVSWYEGSTGAYICFTSNANKSKQ